MQTEPLRTSGKSSSYTAMRRILSDLQNHSLSWAFLQPVNKDEVPDYYNVIKSPMGKIFQSREPGYDIELETP